MSSGPEFLRRRALPPELHDLPSSVPEALAARAEHADDPFVIGPDFRLTFGEAECRSAELAGRLLAAGIGKGTRVGILYPNNAEWAVVWLAAARIGALTIPLSTFAPGAELARTLRQTDVHALLMVDRFGDASLCARVEDGLADLSDDGNALALESAPYLRWIHVDGEPRPWSRELPPPLPEAVVRAAEAEVGPADGLVIISTSGTTAAPKAVIHSHGSLVRHAALMAGRRGMDRNDHLYSPMPFFWVGGLTMILLSSLTTGAAGLVQERFDAGEALALAERERATQISCWPNAARAMADHPTFASRDLRAVRGGTLLEALPPELRPGAPDLVPRLLGMSETGGPHTYPDDPYAPLPDEFRGTFGRSLTGMEHRIVDLDTGAVLEAEQEGEILLRGHFLMDALDKHERHETFTPDGWYATGDLGWFGADGLLRFTGRRTPMIKTAGSNVSPAEVEAALADLPEVRTAFVFGIPAGDRREAVAAVVVTHPSPALDHDGLVAALRKTLSSYKIPRHFRVLEESNVPVLPTGKVDLAALRSLFEGESSGGIEREDAHSIVG